MIKQGKQIGSPFTRAGSGAYCLLCQKAEQALTILRFLSLLGANTWQEGRLREQMSSIIDLLRPSFQEVKINKFELTVNKRFFRFSLTIQFREL